MAVTTFTKGGNILKEHSSAALEYWFFKVNSGPIALLVDWIALRKSGEKWLRASIHSPYRREVLFEKQADLIPETNYLKPQRTAGQIGEISWQLELNPGPDWIHPDIFPAGLLRMADLSLNSAPLATFSGTIRHGDQLATLEDAPGIISQYWGRSLAPEWWWVSASQFDQPGIAVECSLNRSRLWGTKLETSLAYLYLKRQGKCELRVAPGSLAHVEGSPEKFTIEVKRIGAKPVRLIGTGRDYGDLGDGIINTLVGDLEVFMGEEQVACAYGTAGLEHRDPQAGNTWDHLF